MEARGYSRRDVLQNSRIDATRLTDPTYLVTPEQCHTVVSNMLRLTGDSGLGLSTGRDIALTDLGVVGHAMAASVTLGEAIDLWMRYGNSPVGGPFTMEVTPAADGSWRVSAASGHMDENVYRFYVEETIAMGIGVGQILTGRKPIVKEACFSYPAPTHWKRYEHLLNCTLEFDADATRAVVKSPGLDAPVRSYDPELRELCIRHCSLLIRRLQRGGAVSTRLRMLLVTERRVIDLSGAAEALNMSPRSLRRHLHAEGVTFQEVLDEFRKDLADQYLNAGAMSVKEVASLVGFSSVDSFRRAYKAWEQRRRSRELSNTDDCSAYLAMRKPLDRVDRHIGQF
jgi:AraC-like DNA-binding protein